METTVVKTSDVTIYIHDDDCNSGMDTVVQEVAGMIFDVCKRNAEGGLKSSRTYGDVQP